MGINVVNGDTMRERTFVPALHEFLDHVRSSHPRTPVALVTALVCPAHEDATGPTRPGPDGRAAATPRPVPVGDGSLTLRRTRELVTALPDGLHPDRAGHDLIAARFTPIARGLLGRP